MMRALWSSATGMGAQQLNLDVISNNLANVNTNGFKKGRPDFQDLMYQTLRPAGAKTAAGTDVPTSVQVGLGVRTVDIEKLFSQGTFRETGNQLDIAIEGRGFFKVIFNGEEVYTRSGAFKLDAEGNVVDPLGNALEPNFQVPAEAVTVTVDQTGMITALGAGGEELAGPTQIEIYDFINPAGLEAVGRNLFRPTPSSGDPVAGTPGTDNLGTLAQGFLEMSNVNVVEEMVAMIVAQRAYESNSKAIQTADQMLQMANNVKR
ncbi:MAG: flagellar basal-body rod protein FlgG [Deltaproteobacteria bacterium]|nr:flagellar basal-body rod protein FlgG [Deltaproteobacteria bacterium]